MKKKKITKIMKLSAGPRCNSTRYQPSLLFLAGPSSISCRTIDRERRTDVERNDWRPNIAETATECRHSTLHAAVAPVNSSIRWAWWSKWILYSVPVLLRCWSQYPHHDPEKLGPCNWITLAEAIACWSKMNKFSKSYPLKFSSPREK